MATPVFSIRESFAAAWRRTRENFWFLVCVLLVMLVAGTVPSMLAKACAGHWLLSCALHASAFFFQSVTAMGMVKISLALIDNRKAALSSLFDCAPLFFRYAGGFALYLLAVVGGLLLLVVPGIVWAMKYQFMVYGIVDAHAGPVASLRRSAVLTRGNKAHLLLFVLVTIGVNVLGIAALVAGLLVTLPLTSLAAAHVYRTLSTAADAPAGIAASAGLSEGEGI